MKDIDQAKIKKIFKKIFQRQEKFRKGEPLSQILH